MSMMPMRKGLLRTQAYSGCMGRRTTIGKRKPCRGVKAESQADIILSYIHKSKGRHEGGEVCNTLLEEGDLPTSGSH